MNDGGSGLNAEPPDLEYISSAESPAEGDSAEEMYSRFVLQARAMNDATRCMTLSVNESNENSKSLRSL